MEGTMSAFILQAQRMAQEERDEIVINVLSFIGYDPFDALPLVRVRMARSDEMSMIYEINGVNFLKTSEQVVLNAKSACIKLDFEILREKILK